MWKALQMCIYHLNDYMYIDSYMQRKSKKSKISASLNLGPLE